MLRAKPNSFEEAERAALEYYSCRRLTKNNVQFSSVIQSEVNVLYRRKSFSASHRRRSFSYSSAGSQSSSASRQPRDRQQRGRSPRLVGKSIPSYLVVDRRVQGTISAVLCRGVATLRGRSSLLRHSNDVLGLLSATSVLDHSPLDVAMALPEPILERNLVLLTIRAIALRPWKLMC